MSKIIDEFVGEVTEQKTKQLLGIALDKGYWTSIIEGVDIDKLRKELGEEKAKIVKSNGGATLTDARDLVRINELESEINNFEKAEQELTRLKLMEKQIHHYLSFVTNPSKELRAEMERVAGNK